jgi:hypothetical protein
MHHLRDALIACAMTTLLLPATASAAVPAPTVTGPIKVVEGSRPWFATEIDLASQGYVEQEFFFEGEAADGSAYKTRMMVRRPVSAERFNGTAVVEWFNVTGNYDAEWDWFNSHEFFTRRGWIWVGISAQYAGVNALRSYDSERYGSLQVSDTQSADIYAQAGQALRSPKGVDPLGGLRPKLMIADGHSQSADKLAQYFNAQHAQDPLYDAFFLRGFNRAVRQDVPTKAVRLLSETDVSPVMQGLSGTDPTPDGDRYRRWEVAATSHVTWKEMREVERLVNRDRGYGTPRQCTKPPFSRVSFHHAQNALYSHLERWLQGGPPPPSSPRMEVESDAVRLKRDERGFVVGGIRLPELAVPTALQTGENNGAVCCVLYGSREPFAEAELLTANPSRAAYVARMDAAIERSVADGYMLAEDAPGLCREARASQLGWKEPQPPIDDLECPFATVPAQAASAGGPPAVVPTGQLGLPSAKRCVRRGALRLRLRAPRGERLRSARIYVGSKRVMALRGRALRGRLVLRGLPRRGARVRVVGHTASGRTVVQTRRYRGCR